MLVIISWYDSVKCETLECEHMNSWNKYGDECDSKIQMYWFVTIYILGGAIGIGPLSRQEQPTGGASRWLSPSFFITLNNEILYHECYRIVLVQISDCQMLKCWQVVD
jgi:hypothetical protein